jgi:isocitrate/isopropylmalate dehydrogenase
MVMWDEIAGSAFDIVGEDIANPMRRSGREA